MILDILETHHCNKYVYTRTFKFSEQDYLDAIAELKELEATIEAQEIIIKDKSAIMEAMAQPKTCELDCVYLDNEYGCQCPFPCKRSEDDDIKDYYQPKAQP